MSEQNKALVHRWFEEVWNKGRAEAITELLAPDALIHGLSDDGATSWQGPTVFKEFHTKFRTAFPEILVTVEDTICEGDKVAARCKVRGKHSGDSLGFAATEALVEFSGVAIVRVKDEQIVEAWNNFDFMTLYKQLGVI
jgi:steroid delta-isomerase-like uncharacterized protein